MPILQVRLDRVVSDIDLPGTPLWPQSAPYDQLRLRYVRDDVWRLECARGDSVDPDLVGDIVIACEAPGGTIRSINVGTLPLPRPFAAVELGELRKGSDEFRILLNAGVVAETGIGLTTEALRALQSEGFDYFAISELSSAIADLRTWPTKPVNRRVALPLELVRGVVDEPATFRDAASGRIPLDSGTPAKLIRRVRDSEPWTSDRLARVLDEVAARIEATAVAATLVRTLRSASVHARSHRGRDVPVSGWPWKFVRAWNAALAVLSNPGRRPGSGESTLPLQRAWSLYEDWVSLEAIRTATDTLGAPTLIDSSRGLWQWTRPDVTVDVWAQPEIGSSRAPAHLIDLFSADLRPDVLLVVTRENRTVSVIDAKRYSGTAAAPGTLSRGESAVHASKYLWALRTAAGDFAITRVLLVSPGGGTVFDKQARTEVVRARPAEVDNLRKSVAAILYGQ